MQKVVDTPNSELSVYFDAPMAAFNGNTATMPSSQDMPQDMPVPKPFSGAHQPVAYQLHDDGPVHAYDADDNDNAQFESRVNGIEKDTRVATHPNGSEGWLPAVDGPRTTSPDKREGSIASVQDRDFGAHSRHPTAGTTYTNSESISSKKGYGAGGASLARTGSRKSTHTASDGRLIPGSAFVNGAGVTGPMATAERDEDLRVRGAEATANLTPKQKTKIAKDEVKRGKNLSKIIKKESKTEKLALATAIAELGQLQKIQKSAVKAESQCQSTHSTVLAASKKTELAYLAAKAKHETALARLHAEEEALEKLREGAREATERMQDKAAEVDALRRVLAVDEREREVLLGELGGKGTLGKREGGGTPRRGEGTGTLGKKGSIWRN